LAWICLLFFVRTATVSDQASPTLVWRLDLQKDLGLRGFQTQFGVAWRSQQDAVFLTPERVLLYQVNQIREPARLAGRDSSGGAGNFSLEIRILDVRYGHLVKTLRLPTSAGFSKIIPTHDGKMIVRTGDSLFLCTDDFQPLASRTLPIRGRRRLKLGRLASRPQAGGSCWSISSSDHRKRGWKQAGVTGP
jgi:hypothetical protein